MSTKNPLVPRRHDWKAWKKEVKSKTTEQLTRDLIGLLGYTADKLQRMAFIVAELESRGHSTAAIRDQFLMRQLRRIAAGDLLPEVVQHFLGSPSLVDVMARLPISEQKCLLDAGSVEVLVNDKMEKIDLHKLTRESVAIAFGTDHVRNEAEQRQLFQKPAIADKPTSQPMPAVEEKREPHYRVRPVPEKKGYEVGKMFVPAEEVVQAQAEAARGTEVPEPDPADKTTETESFYIEAFEKEALRILSRKTGKSVSRLIREAMWAQYAVILNQYKPKN